MVYVANRTLSQSIQAEFFGEFDGMAQQKITREESDRAYLETEDQACLEEGHEYIKINMSEKEKGTASLHSQKTVPVIEDGHIVSAIKVIGSTTGFISPEDKVSFSAWPISSTINQHEKVAKEAINASCNVFISTGKNIIKEISNRISAVHNHTVSFAKTAVNTGSEALTRSADGIKKNLNYGFTYLSSWLSW